MNKWNRNNIELKIEFYMVGKTTLMTSPQYYNNEYRSFKGMSSGRECNLEQVK